MFCEKCGTQLPDDAAFCTKCGVSTAKGAKTTEKVEEKMPDTEVQLNVKPTFKFGYILLPSLICYIIITLMISVPFFATEEPMAGFIIMIAMLLVFAIILAIQTWIKKKQFDNYTYNFYKTKVTFRDSFLNLSEKEVKYKYIREVTMRQTFIQRWFNIGSIILFTNAETGFGNGIFINCVEDVQTVYKNIKSIIYV